MSILLIEYADLGDSGKYSCYPSNTEITSIRVHVLKGKWWYLVVSASGLVSIQQANEQ